MFTYKNAPYKIFALGPKFCWAGPDYPQQIGTATGRVWAGFFIPGPTRGARPVTQTQPV